MTNDKFIDELSKTAALIAPNGNVLKPNLDVILAEYKTIKGNFISKNVYITDNEKIDELN